VLLLLLPQRPPLLQSRQPGQPRRQSPSKAAAGPSRAEGERGAAAPGQLAGLRGASKGEETVAGWGRPDGWPRVAVTAWRRMRVRLASSEEIRSGLRAVRARAGRQIGI
jgi:hypothetical protein